MKQDIPLEDSKEPKDPGLLTRLSWITGFFWLPWLLVSIMLVGMLVAWLYVNREKATARVCEKNLRSIYAALELYELDKGYLPKLDFYPSSPSDDQDSLMVVLRPYGVRPGYCLCPKAPRIVKAAGLSYVWNVKLNNQPLPDSDSTDWLLMEIQALSDKIPGPHLRSNHILYTDGRIERSSAVGPGL